MARTPVSYSTKDYLKSFKKKHPEVKISPKDYYNVLNEAGIAMREMLIDDGQFKLPNRLGHLMIRKFMPRGRGALYVKTGEMVRKTGEVYKIPLNVTMDYKRTNELNTPVFCLNDHSGGYIYRIIWNRSRCQMIEDKDMWIFKPIRSLKRMLASLLMAKEVDYPIGIEKLVV